MCCLIGLCLVILTACGPSEAPSSPGASSNQTQTVAPEPQTASPTSAAVMHDVEFESYDITPTGTEVRQPNFRIAAARGQLNDQNQWSLENVKAVIYSEDGRETAIRAARATYRDVTGQERAVLSGDVQLVSGELRMRVPELNWNNSDRSADADGPIHIVHGKTDLMAASMRFDPETNRVMLRDVSGRVDLKRKDLP